MAAATEKPGSMTHRDERFQKVMEELEEIKRKVVAAKDWFARNSARPRILFRLVGGSLILLSVLVPLLATLEGIWKELVLPSVAVAIAFLTGLNAFYQWQTQWQGNREAQYALEYLLAKWEVETVKARFESDRDKAVVLAIEATDQLLDQAREVTSSTTGEFFKNLKIPTAK